MGSVHETWAFQERTDTHTHTKHWEKACETMKEGRKSDKTKSEVEKISKIGKV